MPRFAICCARAAAHADEVMRVALRAHDALIRQSASITRAASDALRAARTMSTLSPCRVTQNAVLSMRYLAYERRASGGCVTRRKRIKMRVTRAVDVVFAMFVRHATIDGAAAPHYDVVAHGDTGGFTQCARLLRYARRAFSYMRPTTRVYATQSCSVLSQCAF